MQRLSGIVVSSGANRRTALICLECTCGSDRGRTTRGKFDREIFLPCHHRQVDTVWQSIENDL